MPYQRPLSAEGARGGSQDVMPCELRRLLREEVSGALEDFFSVTSKVARANDGEIGIERDPVLTGDAASTFNLIGIGREPAHTSDTVSTLNMIGDLLDEHHLNLQDVSMHELPFCPDSKSKGSRSYDKQLCGLTGSSVDGRQHGESSDLLDIGCTRFETRLPVLLSKHFGILYDRLTARCADLIDGQTERILQLVNEHSTVARDVTTDSKRQPELLPSPSPPSPWPQGLIEPAPDNCGNSSFSACELPQTSVQLCGIFDGAWEDVDGKFYGGATIAFQGESWQPLNPPEQAQRTANYRMQPLDETQCYLYENRADGTSRRFLAIADPAQPDRLEVALTDSHLKWTLRHLSQEEHGKRSKRGRLKLKTDTPQEKKRTAVVSKLIDATDQLSSWSGSQQTNAIGSLYDSFQDWAATLQEPERIGPLANTVESGVFKFLCTATILTQAVHSTLAMNESMQKAEQGHTYEDNAYVDGAFLAFYTVELLLRLLVHRLYFFIGKQWTWNVFDFALVAQSAIDLVVMLAIKDDSGFNMAYLRPLRMFKIAKILRTLRALKYFTEVRLMLFCILQSLSTLFWCLLVIFFVQYLFSMLFVQGMADFLSTESDMSADTRKAMLSAFGSVQKSIISLWMAVTGGDDWSQYYYMIEKTSTWRGFVFILYIAFFVIAAMNIVTGTFVNKAFNIAKPDAESIMAAKMERDIETYKSLAELFKHANKSKTGSLSKDEFVTLISKEKHATLEIMGITLVDAESLFELMRGGEDGEVALETFAQGMLALSGEAKCVDVHLSEYRILAQLRDIHYALNGLAGSITRSATEGHLGA